MNSYEKEEAEAGLDRRKSQADFKRRPHPIPGELWSWNVHQCCPLLGLFITVHSLSYSVYFQIYLPIYISFLELLYHFSDQFLTGRLRLLLWLLQLVSGLQLIFVMSPCSILSKYPLSSVGISSDLCVLSRTLTLGSLSPWSSYVFYCGYWTYPFTITLGERIPQNT